MGNKSLTVRQQEVFDLLVRFYKERGYAPSNAELARMMGIASPTAAHLMLKALQRKGVITIAPGAHRGITINNHTPEDEAITLLRSLVNGEEDAREQAIAFLESYGGAR